MKYVFALLAFVFLNIAPPAQAQDAMVVQTCGTLPQNYAPGATRLVTVDTTGKLCSTGGGGGTAGIQRIDGTSSTVPAMTAGGAMSDTDLVYCAQSGGTTDRKCTGAQVKTYANTSAVRATTTTSEALANSDQNKLVTFSNGSAVACTIAQAGSGGNFAAGWAVSLKNLGAGTVTCTPSTSTVDGAANFTLTTGQGVDLYSDGTNYFTQPGKGGGGTVTTTGSPANGNLTQFSGASSITNGNLSGNCVTSGTLVTNCDAPHPGYISSNWYVSPAWSTTATGNAVGAANRISCKYGYVPNKVTIGALGARINTAGTTNYQLAIYANSSGRPGAILSSTGSMVTTGTGVVTATLAANKQVGPGGTDGSRDVWWCMNINDTTTVFVTENVGGLSQDAFVGSATAADLLPGGTNAQTGIHCTGADCNGGSSTFGTWPATLAGSTWTTMSASSTGNTIPIIIFRAASVP